MATAIIRRDFDRDGVDDLYFVKRRNTGTNSIEVHVLSGASNYQQFALDAKSRWISRGCASGS